MLRFPPTVPQNPPIFTPATVVLSLPSVVEAVAVDFKLISEYTFSISTLLLNAVLEKMEDKPITELCIKEFFI